MPTCFWLATVSTALLLASATQQTPLQQLLLVASSKRVPLGIVIADSTRLCEPKPQPPLHPDMHRILLGTGYRSYSQRGVLQVRPINILFPGRGTAGDILAPINAENIPPFVLHNVSVEDAANNIVSRAGKGAWILYRNSHASAKQLEFKSFGYTDDSNYLRDTPCIVDR